MNIIIIMRKFAGRLKELRQEENLSFEKLSKLTGLSSSVLCNYEKGKNDVTGDNLIILAKHFKVTTDYLLGLED